MTQATENRRHSFSSNYELTLQYDHLKYRLRAKFDNNQVDCSGWSGFLVNASMDSANSYLNKEIFSKADHMSKGFDSASSIIQKAASRTGFLLTGNEIRKDILREGMIIGEDNGRTSFDKGRYKGIDHIVSVVKNPNTGELMISQSASSKGGVSLITVDKYFEEIGRRRHTKLFLADPLHNVRDELEMKQRELEQSSESKPAAEAANREAAMETFSSQGSLAKHMSDMARKLNPEGNDNDSSPKPGGSDPGMDM